MTRTAKGLELNWHSQGTYPFADEMVELHLHGMKLQQVWVDDREVRFGSPAPETSPVKIAPGMVVCCDRFQQVRFLGRMD